MIIIIPSLPVVRVYVRVCVRACMYAFVCVCACIRVQACVHAHVHRANLSRDTHNTHMHKTAKSGYAYPVMPTEWCAETFR